ncbi:hypothetical protein [Roseibium sp. Sym1]|uniref:hypothetical protein n=1 Tax=Roseibium sp. Sym1 TaxID=3016006 RepID=UPI0022B44851|nr:hypothetical protein [Roseibium sp. Sym1]
MSGWKTVLFNGGLGIVALIAELLNYLSVFNWREVLPPEYAPGVILGIGVANIVLRHVTTGPAGWRQK